MALGIEQILASATNFLFGRKTTGAGPGEELTASDVLDMVGSTRGSILIRSASGWSVLTPGTAGYALASNGSGADPSYQSLAGTPGVDAFTTSTASFTQPASGATVSVSVGSTAWMGVGQTLYVVGGGYYSVSSLTNATTVILTNLGYTGNAAAAASVATAAKVSPGGVPGPSGSAVYSTDYVLNGFLLATAPLITIGASKQAVTSATSYQQLVRADVSGSVTKVFFGVSIAGSTLTANSGSTVNNGIVLTDTSGSVLAWANCASAFASAGVQTVSLSATVSLTAGTNYLIFLISIGTTTPQLFIPALNTVLNTGISAFPYRAGSKSSTTLSNTGTLTLTGYTASQVPVWIALGN